jgi:GMP synthase (glutamine-hydrolysing)
MRARQSCLAPLADEGATVLHWHGDTFDPPHGSTRLASTKLFENQAFAYGRNASALQFHLEADPPCLAQWYVGHAAELAAAGIAVPHLRAATAAVAGRVCQQARRIFIQWLRRAC